MTAEQQWAGAGLDRLDYWSDRSLPWIVEGSGERNNRQVVEAICALMDQLRPQGTPHARLITLVSDRPGHDRRYSINPTLIQSELGWQHRHTFEQGLESTMRWFLENIDWCQVVQQGNG